MARSDCVQVRLDVGGVGALEVGTFWRFNEQVADRSGQFLEQSVEIRTREDEGVCVGRR